MTDGSLKVRGPVRSARDHDRRAKEIRDERRHRRRIRLTPYLYVSPFFILFALVGVFPLVYSGYLSLFDWNRLAYQRGDFIGLENYTWLFRDPVFWRSLVNTLSIFIMTAVPQVVIALCVAALLDNRLRCSTLWRMSVLLPFVVAPAAVALIFGSLFADTYGVINAALKGIGLEPIRWHVDRWWSHFAISTMVNWRWTGYNTLIFLAAMQAVPRELYEAASIDGAGKVKQFISVTIPMIRSTMIFVIVTCTIGAMQIFAEPRLFDDSPQREGGADRQYMTTVLYIYVKGIEDQFYGRASAAAWVLFLIIIALAALNFAVVRLITRRSQR